MQWIARAFVAIALLAVTGCAQPFWRQPPPPPPIAYGPATERQIEQSLQRYSSRIVAMDAAAVADMYAPDGVWERQSGPLQGREAIRQALSSAGNVRVLSNEMTTSYLSYNGPAVIQTGDFRQSARLGDGRIVSASGRFEATWVRGSTGEWWIRRMVIRPNR